MGSSSGSRSPWTAKRYHDTAKNAAKVLWKRLGRHQKMYLLVLLSSSCQIEGEQDNLTRSGGVRNVSLDSTPYDFPVGRLMISAVDSALVFNPGRYYCVEYLCMTLYPHSASLLPGV